MKLMMDAQSENPIKVRYMQRYYIDSIKTECFHEIAFYYDYDLGNLGMYCTCDLQTAL